MLDVPFVPYVQLAQQGLDHGSLRFKSQRSVPLMMAFGPSLGNWQAVDHERRPDYDLLFCIAATAPPHSVGVVGALWQVRQTPKRSLKNHEEQDECLSNPRWHPGFGWAEKGLHFDRLPEWARGRLGLMGVTDPVQPLSGRPMEELVGGRRVTSLMDQAHRDRGRLPAAA